MYALWTVVMFICHYNTIKKNRSFIYLMMEGRNSAVERESRRGNRGEAGLIFLSYSMPNNTKKGALIHIKAPFFVSGNRWVIIQLKRTIC